MKKSSWALLVALVALITAIGSFFTTTGGHNAGSTANQTSTAGYYNAGLGFKINGTIVFNSSKQLVVGTSGSAVSRVVFGTCVINAAAQTIAASTTKQVDCTSNGTASGTLTGIQANDKIDAWATTSISSLAQGVSVIASTASTTAGIITLTVSNGTGATFTWSGAASSTIAWLDIQ